MRKPQCGINLPGAVTPDDVDQYFLNNSRRKGEFVLALALLMDEYLDSVIVPDHINDMFTWLYDGTESGSTQADDLI